MGIFNELKFNVHEKVFFHVFKNPDKGFGFAAKLDKDYLTEIQVETCNYLVRCQKKGLLGSFTIIFNTDGVGEITINRRVEKIQFINGAYEISNTY